MKPNKNLNTLKGESIIFNYTNVSMDIKSQKGGLKILIGILIVLILAAGVLLAMKYFQENGTEKTSNENVDGMEIKKEEEKKPVTFSGTDRPIAVMIDNHKNAMPQANLQEAEIVYEIIVEYGETRLMAIYKGDDLDKIGPIRSARHYFVDYALENDAIYVHFGESPQAEEAIDKYFVQDINGINESEDYFWRTDDRYAPHNVVTDTKSILEIAKEKGYRTTSDEESVLNYVVDEVNLENGQSAENIVIPYSDYNTVSYEYDSENKNYIRYSRDEKQVDWDTEEPVTVKNIIIAKVENSTLNDGSDKDRQTIDNIGTLEGYYITNGKAIPITCEKESVTSKTVYKDLDGNEIKVNDGNTFIQMCPEDADITIEGIEDTSN